MAKSYTVRAEQRLAPDLPFDRNLSGGGGAGARSPTSRRDLVFVVNPRGTLPHLLGEWLSFPVC